MQSRAWGRGAARWIALDELCTGLLPRPPAQRPNRVPEPTDLVYVLYTSGSTGRPKGVEAEIAAITRKPWVRRVVTWQLSGEQPGDLRLSWNIDTGARAALGEELFGKHVLITDHDDWPVAEVVAGYRSQSEAEFSFRQLKDTRVVSFSPMHHWTEHNARVHVFTCVLALQVADLMRLKADTPRAVRSYAGKRTHAQAELPEHQARRKIIGKSG